jgi:hypothetical protein
MICEGMICYAPSTGGDGGPSRNQADEAGGAFEDCSNWVCSYLSKCLAEFWARQTGFDINEVREDFTCPRED